MCGSVGGGDFVVVVFVFLHVRGLRGGGEVGFDGSPPLCGLLVVFCWGF